jgi:hypothetical protein
MQCVTISLLLITGAAVSQENRFIARNDGTVLDTKTHLVWAAQDSRSRLSVDDARAYLENFQEVKTARLQPPSRAIRHESEALACSEPRCYVSKESPSGTAHTAEFCVDDHH